MQQLTPSSPHTRATDTNHKALDKSQKSNASARSKFAALRFQTPQTFSPLPPRAKIRAHIHKSNVSVIFLIFPLFPCKLFLKLTYTLSRLPDSIHHIILHDNSSNPSYPHGPLFPFSRLFHFHAHHQYRDCKETNNREPGFPLERFYKERASKSGRGVLFFNNHSDITVREFRDKMNMRPIDCFVPAPNAYVA